MRKIFAAIILTVLMAGASLADVLYLKDGSVLKGNFAGYENGKFIFETGGNRLEFRPDQVLRLVVDRNDRRPPIAPRPPLERTERRPPGDAGDPPYSSGKRPDLIRTFDVKLEDQYFRTPIELRRGQHVRIEATGTIYLGGRTATGPEGLRGRTDPDAPMPQENDGALIAAIGQDPDSPPIFIGSSREFTSDGDGILYLTVNHGETRDARGSFRVNVIIDRGGSRSGQPRGGIGAGERSADERPGGSRTGQAREKTITVYANQPWIDTGIDVEPNMTFSITAEGMIELDSRNRSEPNGNSSAINSTSSYPMSDVAPGALIGKIRYRDGRDSNFVFIGSRGEPTTEPNEYGRLFLGINDDYFRDNTGSYKVTIRW
ncbi:MAG TPA: hypothetical protein VFY40_04475 [Blastocatellia bacterium]|nr:hypothetical protein [Blastocatellia bacterium]